MVTNHWVRSCGSRDHVFNPIPWSWNILWESCGGGVCIYQLRGHRCQHRQQPPPHRRKYHHGAQSFSSTMPILPRRSGITGTGGCCEEEDGGVNGQTVGRVRQHASGQYGQVRPGAGAGGCKDAGNLKGGKAHFVRYNMQSSALRVLCKLSILRTRQLARCIVQFVHFARCLGEVSSRQDLVQRPSTQGAG